MGEVPEKIILPSSERSNLEPQLIQAFLETDFRVEISLGASLVLNIGEQNDPLRRLHELSNVTSSAFITAWNPRSKLTDQSTNTQLNNALKEHLRLLGFNVYPGLGLHPSGSWDGEESILVLGMSLAKAIECGNTFDQNAIVWTGKEGIPQLVLLQ